MILTFDPQVISDLKDAIDGEGQAALAVQAEQAMVFINAVAAKEDACNKSVESETDLGDQDFQDELAAITSPVPVIQPGDRSTLDGILDALPEPLKTWGKHLKCALDLIGALILCETTHGESHTDPDAYDNEDFIGCMVEAYIAYFECRDAIANP